MNCRRKFLIEVCQYDCYNRIANFNSRYYTPEIRIWLSVDPDGREIYPEIFELIPKVQQSYKMMTR